MIGGIDPELSWVMLMSFGVLFAQTLGSSAGSRH